VYYEWAKILINDRFSRTFDWPYHACYIGRKHHKPYAHSHEQILARYGDRIVQQQPMAAVFRRAMGDHGYVARSPNLDEVLEIARYIQQT
jgi:hypothetical protein